MGKEFKWEDTLMLSKWVFNFATVSEDEKKLESVNLKTYAKYLT